jgi:3-dehydroquinate dehydratase-2
MTQTVYILNGPNLNLLGEREPEIYGYDTLAMINPAGFSFTSVALLDSLKAFDGVKLEVHLSNIHKREAIYHHSLVSKTADAVIAGLGADGYLLALDALARKLAAKKQTIV